MLCSKGLLQGALDSARSLTGARYGVTATLDGPYRLIDFAAFSGKGDSIKAWGSC